MIDSHLVPNPEWGIRPILFFIGKFPVPSYSFFMILAIVVGCLVYWNEARKTKRNDENGFYILIGALIGGALGAKLPIIFLYWDQIVANLPDISFLLSGRTILGGLIGGFIGVKIVKYKLNIKEKRGNLFAPAIALGVAIGRIGCFLRGCCYGKETLLPWGINFGDGFLRHPTELYESIFMLGMFVYLSWRKTKNPAPGSLFNVLMLSYFTFRFFIEFIRVEPIFLIGLTAFQWICIVAIGYLLIKK